MGPLFVAFLLHLPLLQQPSRDEVKGDARALEFITRVVDTTMYNLPDQGMTRALVTLRVKELDSLVPGFKAVLFWQDKPRVDELYLHGVTEERKADFEELRTNLVLYGIIRTALLRPTSEYFSTYVATGFEEKDDTVKVTLDPKPGVQADKIERWYTPAGRLLREKRSLKGQEIQTVYDTVRVGEHYLIRSVDIDYLGQRTERWQCHYREQDGRQVLHRIVRSLNGADGSVQFEYAIEIKMDDAISEDDVKRAREK